MLGGVSAGSALQSGSSRSTAATASDTERPGNAGRAVSISYSTHPKAHTSVRPSTSSPVTCSGLMYRAVPRTMPTTVIGSAASSRFRPRTYLFRKTEVHQLRATIAHQHDVGRFQVAVNHALRMCFFQPSDDLQGNVERLPIAMRPRTSRCASVSPSTRSRTR